MRLPRLVRSGKQNSEDRIQRFLFFAVKPPIEIRYSPIGFQITHPKYRYVFTFWGFVMWNKFGSKREGLFSFSRRCTAKRLNSMLVILGMMFTWKIKGQGAKI